MWRLLYSIPLWLSFAVLILIPSIILGWLLIPIAVLCKAYYTMIVVDENMNKLSEKTHFTWSFMHIWDNWEDGIAAGRKYKDWGVLWKQIIWWSCVRNPANNLRIVPYLSCKINPLKVCFIGSFGNYGCGPTLVEPSKWAKYDTKVPQWFFAWQGLYSNFYWQFWWGSQLKRFWIGHKVMPADIFGVSPYRQPGAGFALQFKTVARR